MPLEYGWWNEVLRYGITPTGIITTGKDYFDDLRRKAEIYDIVFSIWWSKLKANAELKGVEIGEEKEDYRAAFEAEMIGAKWTYANNPSDLDN